MLPGLGEPFDLRLRILALLCFRDSKGNKFLDSKEEKTPTVHVQRLFLPFSLDSLHHIHCTGVSNKESFRCLGCFLIRFSVKSNSAVGQSKEECLFVHSWWNPHKILRQGVFIPRVQS